MVPAYKNYEMDVKLTTTFPIDMVVAFVNDITTSWVYISFQASSRWHAPQKAVFLCTPIYNIVTMLKHTQSMLNDKKWINKVGNWLSLESKQFRSSEHSKNEKEGAFPP